MYGFTNIPKLLSSALPFLLIACSSTKEYHLTLLQGNPTEKVDLNAEIKQEFELSLPYVISNIVLDGNNLYIDFQYHMSCTGQDEIEFIGLPLDVNFSPPRRNARMVIHAFDKSCQQLAYKTIVINISELSSSKDFRNEVDLFIDGWRLRPMKYIYVTPYSEKM